MDAERPESSRLIEESSVEEDVWIDLATLSLITSSLMSGTLFVVGVSLTACFRRGSLDSALDSALTGIRFSGAVAIGLGTTEVSLADGARTVGPRVLFPNNLACAFGADVTGLGGKE